MKTCAFSEVLIQDLKRTQENVNGDLPLKGQPLMCHLPVSLIDVRKIDAETRENYCFNR